MPDELPPEPKFRWQTRLSSEGVGGIAATNEYVIVGSRDLLDHEDVFTCHRLHDGQEVWQIRYPAPGRLDYGNAPRSTPLVAGETVVMLGAFGHLVAAELSTGKIIWQHEFQSEFDARLPIWGFCGSPILAEVEDDGVDKQVCIVQPGAIDASLVAFDLADGNVVWKIAGRGPGYSSFILAKVNGQSQLIGYDEHTLGGWSLQGKRLWTITPEFEGDFNVPTPLIIGNRLFVTTENNGSRLFTFDAQGKINSRPDSSFEDLAPDTNTPVATKDMICGISHGLYCLTQQDLVQRHLLHDSAFDDFASVISDGKNKLLITSFAGELLLVEVSPSDCRIKSRLQLTDEEEIMAHPAIVGNQLIVRFGRKLMCLEL